MVLINTFQSELRNEQLFRPDEVRYDQMPFVVALIQGCFDFDVPPESMLLIGGHRQNVFTKIGAQS